MTYATAKVMPDDAEYSIRLDILHWQLDHATRCLTMLRRYGEIRAIRRQQRYITRLVLQISLINQLIGA